MSDRKEQYWKANIKVLTTCLIVWFVSSYLFGIVLVDELNNIRLGGYKLGFWFAQQGSIYVFLILIYYYAKKMDKIDQQFGAEE